MRMSIRCQNSPDPGHQSSGPSLPRYSRDPRFENWQNTWRAIHPFQFAWLAEGTATMSLPSAIRRHLLRSTFTIQISLTKLFSWCKKVAVLLTPAAMQTIAGFSLTMDTESNCRHKTGEKADGGIANAAVAFFVAVPVLVPIPAVQWH